MVEAHAALGVVIHSVGGSFTVLSHLPCLIRTSGPFSLIQTKVTGVNTPPGPWSGLLTKQPDHGPPEKSGLGLFPSDPWFGLLQVRMQFGT